MIAAGDYTGSLFMPCPPGHLKARATPTFKVYIHVQAAIQLVKLHLVGSQMGPYPGRTVYHEMYKNLSCKSMVIEKIKCFLNVH